MTSLVRARALVAAGAALAGLLAGLTACSSDTSSTPQVASLPSTPTVEASGRTTAQPNAALPSRNARTELDRTLPLGATRVQSDRLDAVWHACWKAVGIPPTGSQRGETALITTWKLHDMGRRRDLDAKFAACDYLEPKQPPELDPTTNPDYWDELRVQATCVRAKGYDVSVEKGDIPGLSLGGSAMAEMGSPKFERDFGTCEVKAFSR